MLEAGENFAPAAGAWADAATPTAPAAVDRTTLLSALTMAWAQHGRRSGC